MIYRHSKKFCERVYSMLHMMDIAHVMHYDDEKLVCIMMRRMACITMGCIRCVNYEACGWCSNHLSYVLEVDCATMIPATRLKVPDGDASGGHGDASRVSPRGTYIII